MRCLLLLNTFSKDNFNIYTSSEDYDQVCQNIINQSSYYDICILSNDEHDKTDKEFQYIPYHGIKNSLSYMRNFDFEEQLKINYFLYWPKTTLSPFSNLHYKELFLHYKIDEITVGGFYGCIDIIPTCLDLIDMKQSVITNESIIGDYTVEYKQQCISLLKNYNICK